MDDFLGAYGFRVRGVGGEGSRLIEVPHDWPELTVEYAPYSDREAAPPGTVAILEDSATLWLPGGERIEVDRALSRIRLVMRERPTPEAVAHPLVGLPAAIVSNWRGRLALHGGAFSFGIGGWALLGRRGAGKSTTLAQLLGKGCQIVSDDLLIIDGRTLYCGPRSIDLRSEAADLLGGESMGVLGSRARWRLRPGPMPPEVPVLGFIELRWGDEVSIQPLSAAERLRLLYANSAVYPRPEQAAALLELLVLPAWQFTRPDDLAGSAAAVTQLADLLSP